jgi:hypothetical protein
MASPSQYQALLPIFDNVSSMSVSVLPVKPETTSAAMVSGSFADYPMTAGTRPAGKPGGASSGNLVDTSEFARDTGLIFRGNFLS